MTVQKMTRDELIAAAQQGRVYQVYRDKTR
jgi:hypothetical protein